MPLPHLYGRFIILEEFCELQGKMVSLHFLTLLNNQHSKPSPTSPQPYVINGPLVSKMLVAKLGDDTNFTTSSPQPNIRQKQSLKSAEQ